MKILFSKKGKNVWIADKDKLIFRVDGTYYNHMGEEVPTESSFEEQIRSIYDDSDESWYQYWMDYEELEEPLKADSTTEVINEIDDCFGNFGFKNEAGDFVIEPQYAYAHDFTKGLAAVNLNRTWYRTSEGNRYYENHYGYIDHRGKTVIAFQYDEAYPFNKYGVALVSGYGEEWHLIDMQGNEIPDTRFPYISKFGFEERFIEFSRDDNAFDNDGLVGIYDTKERKIMFEPSVDTIIEWEEDCIAVYKSFEKDGMEFSHQYYINSKGEVIYPWLHKAKFSVVERPDINFVTAVASTKLIESEDNSIFGFEHNGRKYRKKLIFGLYSSKETFLLPKEYDKIEKLSDDIWCCFKDGIFTIVKTEQGD